MSGTVGILNVGAGDTKLVFDKDNPADCIRAARVVKDMLRRGYALLVEVEQRGGGKKYQRVYEFDDKKFEYVIADLDPEAAAKADAEEAVHEPATAETGATRSEASKPRRGRPRGIATKTVPATATKAVAVARTAGG